MRQHGDLVAALTSHLADPAEVFCVGLRVTGRLPQQFPQLAQVLLNSGAQYLMADEGLAPQALRDIRAAMAIGRFDVEDAELALVMTGGALLGLLKLLEARPDADSGELADQFAVRVLRSCGLSRTEARKQVARCRSRPPTKPGHLLQAGGRDLRAYAFLPYSRLADPTTVL